MRGALHSSAPRQSEQTAVARGGAQSDARRSQFSRVLVLRADQRTPGERWKGCCCARIKRAAAAAAAAFACALRDCFCLPSATTFYASLQKLLWKSRFVRSLGCALQAHSQFPIKLYLANFSLSRSFVRSLVRSFVRSFFGLGRRCCRSSAQEAQQRSIVTTKASSRRNSASRGNSFTLALSHSASDNRSTRRHESSLLSLTKPGSASLKLAPTLTNCLASS